MAKASLDYNATGTKTTTEKYNYLKLAENAYKLKTGARGIGDIIDSATWMAYNEAVSIASTI